MRAVYARAEPPGEDAKKAAAAKEKVNLHRAGLKPVAEASAATLPPTTVVASTTTEATFLKRLHHGACSIFGTVLGPVVGAFILTPLGEGLIALTARLGIDVPGVKAVFYGLTLIAIIYFRPSGVWPWLARMLGVAGRAP